MNGYKEIEKPCQFVKYRKPAPGDEVVISGIAGRFPDSDNIEIFQENILNSKDLTSIDDRRWKLDHPEIPQRNGKINNIEKFDASFFGIYFKQAHTMDPMCRMLLEHSYEAILDAGVNPMSLRGKRVGVFVGACFSESEKTWFYEKLQVNGYGITGCSRAMMSNRISYWLGVTGPSYTVDSACSSSLFAMEHAYRAISNGLCDSAIVGGSNLCLHPYVSLQFFRLGVLSIDGRCKCFDESANGYTRSEAVAVVYLQKAKDAKRIYATVVHGKTNCDGYKEQGITFPSSEMQGALFQEFYQECGLSTDCVTFMEAHGTGTRVGDPEELNAIEKVFCVSRKEPLKVGSVKSNIGHTEPASGICSIAKAVITMETGLIPPNINYKTPREGVKSLLDGRIKIVTEPTPLDGDYIGVNSFGFGGANAHILLKAHQKTKVNKGLPQDDLPRLVAISGRTEEGVATMLNDLENRPVDAEYIALYHNIFRDEIPDHPYRGYTIAGLKTKLREIEHFDGTKRPVWFVFSGMGSQWPGMGQSLMRFPVFAKAIEKCDAVLRQRKINVYDVITKKDKNTLDNILHSFVGIAAIQIGLVDLLSSVGVVPDYIVGHSVGELACAYADGCFTAEQTILAAYARGMAALESKVVRGSMAVVGLGYKNLKDLCPADIEIACHNGPDNSTVSGPAESVKAFVEKLQANKISVKEIPCNNIPFQSRYVAAVGPKLLTYLKEVIPEAKLRSPKWLSTSIPRNEWSAQAARYSSAEYHTNNLLKPVLFEEVANSIPDNAVTVEISPDGVLQTILKKSLNSSITNISLTQRGHNDNVEVFLQGIGKLYNAGVQPDVAKLYPPVQFPVSRSTPMISPLIKWDHTYDWYVTSYKMQEKIVSGERVIEISIVDEDYEYIGGHVIDGRNLFPATGYLSLVWETLGMMLGQLYTEVSVILEDVKFNRATTVPKEGIVEMTVMIQKGSGRFEVVEGGNAIVTGMIHEATDLEDNKVPMDLINANADDEEEVMKMKDIYKELRLRGYQYSGLFRSLASCTVSGSKGHIEWKNNWVAFMDNMMQLKILDMDTRGLFVPTGIRKLVIDAKYHQRYLRSLPDDTKFIPVRSYKNFDTLVAGGVELHGLRASTIARKKPLGDPVIEEYRFVAHRDKAETSLREILTVSTHIALENIPLVKVKTVELIDEGDNVSEENLASPLLVDILGNLPLIQATVNLHTPPNKYDEESVPGTVAVSDLKKIQLDGTGLLAIGYGLLTKENNDKLKELLQCVQKGAFILSCERIDAPLNLSLLETFKMNIILEKRTSKNSWILLRKKDEVTYNTMLINISNDDFEWLRQVQTILIKEAEEGLRNTKVILVNNGEFDSGLLGFINCLRREPGGEIFYAVLIQDEKAPKFSLKLPLYAEQLDLNLIINVLRPGNVWGSYRHLLLPPVEPQLVYHGFVNQLTRGDLSSLRWLEGPIRKDSNNENLAHVYFASLNFKDVMLATGKIAAEVIVDDRKDLECVIGLEYSGVTNSGRRVMGINPTRCLSNICVMDPIFTWDIPDNWSLEDAATVPCVYSTCIYALFSNGNMKKGDKVLIHAGTGGIGQAAINLALYEGCEVFTTVGTPEKRKFIREHFPSIDDNHIGNSRDTSFEQLILQQTNGRGVDIVLNSLAEEKLQASLRCLAYGGRFLEIGKFDITANSSLAMHAFEKEVSFHGVMLDRLMIASDELKASLSSKLLEVSKTGAVKPIDRTIFAKDQVETAFRYMASGKHIGKVLIRVREDDESPTSSMMCQPAYVCIPGRTYIVLGGLGGFGLELVDWLILRNATNVVITSRSGVTNGYQRLRLNIWKSYGVNVKILVGLEASQRKDCEAILKAANELGPVDAIFNLAVSLRDSICKNQTAKTFEESFKGKAWATKYMDELSRKLCPNLRHFVVFSSVSCGRGNAGQTNYGMANSVMERICEKRAAEGLPGLAVQWGAIGDVGLVADMQEEDKELVIGGTLQQKITSCLQELHGFLLQDKPVVASMVVAEKRAGAFGTNNVVDTVLNIMGVKDLKTVSQHTSLAELGMDSMMAVEIKQTLEREYEIYLTAQDIRSLNFAKLIEMNNAQAEKSNTRSDVAEKEVLGGTKLLIQLFGEQPNSDMVIHLDTKPEKGRSELFVIPGIEGYGSIFKTLAPKLKMPATCFQLASNYEYEIITDMANALLPAILERLKGRKDFTMVAYSFGTIVGIELTRMLESKGFTGKLTLIDGSPDQMKLLINQHMHSTSEEELESNVLLGIMDAFTPSNSAQFVVELAKCTSWDEKLAAFFKVMSPEQRLAFTEESYKPSILSFYHRLKAVIKYNPEPLPYIKAPITLLKPVLGSVQNATQDYGLQKMTQGKVDVHFIEGNHVTMLDNIKVAMAINGEPLEDAEAFKENLMKENSDIMASLNEDEHKRS